MPQQGRHRISDLRSGPDAYRFLLEVATGLHSAIPGETNIFGQFKKAWLDFQRKAQADHAARLAPIMRQLIADTKIIRQAYLVGIGGSSYASLVRKLIAPKSSDRILFIGAGALARSMLPLFSNNILGIWNRHSIKAPARRIERVFSPDQGRQAAVWADHIILTTPPDNRNDATWRRWLAATPSKTVVHLGHRSPDSSVGNRTWNNTSAFYDLDDVFALRREQTDLRSDQLILAHAACRQRARKLAGDDQRAIKNDTPTKRFAVERNTSETSLALA